LISLDLKGEAEPRFGIPELRFGMAESQFGMIEPLPHEVEGLFLDCAIQAL
jgi:hypothetical protein